MTGPLVLKFGGELLEDPARLRVVVAAVSAIARRGPLVIVHGGGKEIDASLETAGIGKHQVEGLRVTDGPTLAVVISVIAGTVNTRFVAALTTAGLASVGLTGADAGCGMVERAAPHRTVGGDVVDLGSVGTPSGAADLRLLTTLTDHGFIPVIACIGLGGDGQLYNVNADTLAGHLAARLQASRLVIAGTTPGVRDNAGATLGTLDPVAIARLIDGGAATAGMIAKLRACEHALSAGVDEVVIVDGRDGTALETAALGEAPATATRLVATTMAGRQSWPR